MLTGSAQRAEALHAGAEVTTTARLIRAGATRSRVQANLDAKRWQRLGRAIVLHAGPLTREQRWHAALINVGPRSVLTGLTAAEFAGLAGWARPEVHVLAPYGAKARRLPDLAIVLYRCQAWPVATWSKYRCEELGSALVRAASSLDRRPACGLLAAAVQQRLITPARLRVALAGSSRARHRPALLAAVADIEGGADALSEIDFLRLCRRYRLPRPQQQKVRRDSMGRRRYLDATWRRADGRMVVVEVDGALHLTVHRWWDDQLRQNELSLADALVLRFPSVIVRTAPDLVAAQLRRALQL
jgi:very-short-patch-repair endonuclease